VFSRNQQEAGSLLAAGMHDLYAETLIKLIVLFSEMMLLCIARPQVLGTSMLFVRHCVCCILHIRCVLQNPCMALYITRHYFLWYAVCSEEGLTQDQSGAANSTRCTDRGLANSLFISGGVVCYNGTTIGSRAVYICNEGFLLMEGNEATRVCQSDANWNGSTPQCISDGRGMYSSQ